VDHRGRPQGVAVPGDIQDESHCGALVARAVEELGGLDVLVNNAAYQMSLDGLESLLDRAARAHLPDERVRHGLALQGGAPHLQPGASIINTSSIQAYQPSPHLLDYASTKAAIVNFTKNLAQDLAEQGIRVNSVAPGPSGRH
jgi:NAD(P)-dependent dehydrogenase (short-subunit alcohol dehydrogenase family)